MSISSNQQLAHKLDMADHPTHPNLRRPATALALKLGWAAALVVAVEVLARFGESLGQVAGVATVLLLQLMGIALLVRALAECLVAILALILVATIVQPPIQEPVTA